jgi:hypothetical protein
MGTSTVLSGLTAHANQMGESAMSDPRDFDRRLEMERMERMGAPTPWGWIAGGVFIIVLLALVFASSDGTQTARDDTASPPATTGMAPKTAPPAVTVPPSDMPSTTGQGGGQRQQ